MKRLFIALMLCLVSISFIYSQEYKVENGSVLMEKVIPTEMTIEQAHDALETYFAGAYNNSNHTNRLNTPTHLVYVGIYADVESFGMGQWRLHVNHNIDIAFKEGRCKVKLTCDVAEVTNGVNTIKYNIADYVPFTDVYKMTATGAPKSTVIKVGTELVTLMDKLMQGIETTLQQTPSIEENW